MIRIKRFPARIDVYEPLDEIEANLLTALSLRRANRESDLNDTNGEIIGLLDLDTGAQWALTAIAGTPMILLHKHDIVRLPETFRTRRERRKCL